MFTNTVNGRRRGRSINMKRIAEFQKVSRERFLQDSGELIEDGGAAYDSLRMPCRATRGSAGYDFYLPCDLTILPSQSIKVPTGIRVRMKEGWVLQIYPRSGLGFKYRLQMDNTVGIIDADYYGADNEGHIFIKMTNDTHDGKALVLHRGDAFAQGIFIEFGITVDDETEGLRTGGLGSTGRRL